MMMDWDWGEIGGITLLVLLIGGLALLGLYIWSIVWSYKDAKKRDKYPVLVALMVALLPSWPLGFIIWLIIR